MVMMIGFSGLANNIVYKFMPGLVGAMERVFAIVVQIFFSILIVQAFINKKYYYIAIAFVLHMMLDFLAVYVNYKFSIVMAEVVVFVFALAGIIFIIMMRPRESKHGDTAVS